MNNALLELDAELNAATDELEEAQSMMTYYVENFYEYEDNANVLYEVQHRYKIIQNYTLVMYHLLNSVEQNLHKCQALLETAVHDVKKVG